MMRIGTVSRWSTAVSLAVLVAVVVAGVLDREEPGGGILLVTATAYNSTPGQTDSDSVLTAYGVTLRPGLKAIAVSRDLARRGLPPGTRVVIQGLPGEWVVADKMARRWKRRIDVYMGDDRRAARDWGRRRVRIRVVGQGNLGKLAADEDASPPDAAGGPPADTALGSARDAAAAPDAIAADTGDGSRENGTPAGEVVAQ